MTAKKKLALLWMHGEVSIITYILRMHQETMQYCTLFVCFACIYVQLERMLVLGLLNTLMTYLVFHNVPLEDGHIGSLSVYTCTEA